MKCFSGSEIWTKKWQDEMNEMGDEATNILINEYPQYDLIKLSHWNPGYDIIFNRYEIKIEVKRRYDSPSVDITKTQWDNSDIISMYDEIKVGYHMLTSDYRKIVKEKDNKSCVFKLSKKSSKYAVIPQSLFRKFPQTTKDLSDLIEPMIKERQPRILISDFMAA